MLPKRSRISAVKSDQNFFRPKVTLKWSKNFYTKSDCENVFGLKMTIKSPPPLYDIIKKWNLTNVERRLCGLVLTLFVMYNQNYV